MGKTGKAGSAKTSKNSLQPQQLTKFLTHDASRPQINGEQHTTPKMADERPSGDEDAALSKTDFLITIQQLKADLADQIKTDIAAAIKPLLDELKTITSTLSEVAQAAESALETAMIAQEEIQHLQKHEEWAKLKIMSIENKLREQHLKFRNLPEDSEGTTELKIFLATWLAGLLNLEDGVAPLINKAYRVELQVFHQNQYFTATDLPSGYQLLSDLGIPCELSPPTSSQDNKRSLDSREDINPPVGPEYAADPALQIGHR
ncbi:UNVERIFIED_CONTAM: hypothetical protein K2H54_047811 [Gekko kuhli]